MVRRVRGCMMLYVLFCCSVSCLSVFPKPNLPLYIIPVCCYVLDSFFDLVFFEFVSHISVSPVSSLAFISQLLSGCFPSYSLSKAPSPGIDSISRINS